MDCGVRRWVFAAQQERKPEVARSKNQKRERVIFHNFNHLTQTPTSNNQHKLQGLRKSFGGRRSSRGQSQAAS
eukprot:scaffold21938_cov76-Skeletonema_dohrnii-CCMP3373.AAC.2